MKITSVMVLVVLFFATIGASAVEKVPQPVGNCFKTKTKAVAIFKDGYGFFLREGKASLADGWCMTDYIPKATLGTFWIYTTDPGTVVDTVRSTSKNEIAFESAAELTALLRGYVGAQVSLSTEDTKTDGELLQMTDDMALVKSGKQIGVVKMSEVKTARILGNPLLIQVKGAKAKDVTVGMGYLQQGVNWIPNYTLDLSDPKEGRLVLKATLTNGVEDLAGCRIFFVVGIPNFALKGQLDPLTINALAAAVLRDMPSSGPSQIAGNSFRAALTFNNDVDTSISVAAPSVNVPVEGLQDLYFYEKPELKIAVGDVVMTTLLTVTVPYRSVFTWNADAGKDVDHYLVLKNTGDTPFTTGPVMVVQNSKPLCQEQLKYISPKAEGRLKLTQTTDIRTDKTERETERRPVEMINGNAYIPVEVEGKLTVENYRTDTSETEITWSLSGKILESSDNADVRAEAVVDQGLNPKSNLKCTVKVEPGKKHVVTYKYLRYVRATT